MTHELAERAGMSRQGAHKHLSKLVRAGRIVREGKGRGARYHRPSPSGLELHYVRKEIDEDRVWKDMLKAPEISNASDNARRIVQYAASELVNNAIDHSGSKTILVLVPGAPREIRFDVIDLGVGIFDHLRRRLKLESKLEAIQELSKGKVTTDPQRHTGEGIFFVSKAADLFEIDSGGLAWRVDNRQGDSAVMESPPRRGTRVRFEIRSNKTRTLKSLFDEYTEDFEFSKTRIVIKLFSYGTWFISRSEAKRVLIGLDKFKEVVLDFTGVEGIGQGFADEVFRVWARAHPKIRITSLQMNSAVEFMVKRAMSTRP